MPQGWGLVFWAAFGVPGWILFYTRFYVQWIASEIQRKSVMPTAFWYMSGVGAVLLFVYAIYTRSPLGALSFCFNLVVYTRNLVHIWRDRGTLSRTLNYAVHGLVAAMTIGAVLLVAYTWYHTWQASSASVEEARKTWLWLAVGVAGQGLFAGRFMVQLIATERRRKSVVPPSFWYMSIIAAALMAASFVASGGTDWLYALGMFVTMPIYARNIWFIRRDTPQKGNSGE